MKICIISHDYDSCYDAMTVKGKKNALLYNYSLPAKQINDSIRAEHKKLLKEITKQATHVDVYCGSVRQSKSHDDKMALKNNNGSAFYNFRQLCQVNNTKLKTWKYQPLLLTDFIYKLPAGTAELNNKFSVIDLPKIQMLKMQMWDSYNRSSKKCDLDFYFIDDKESLFIPIIQYFKMNPLQIPPNMSFTLILFDSYGAYYNVKNYNQEIFKFNILKSQSMILPQKTKLSIKEEKNEIVREFLVKTFDDDCPSPQYRDAFFQDQTKRKINDINELNHNSIICSGKKLKQSY